MSDTPFVSGLEGIVAAETRLSKVDGEAGELLIAGFPVDLLAPLADFEEVVYLLWNGQLPTREQLADFRAELTARRGLSSATLAVLRDAARREAPSMDALRMATATLGPTDGPSTDARGQAVRLVAAFPTLVAAYHRLRAGSEPVEPDPDLNHVENMLFMLEAAHPRAQRVRGLTTYLNTVVDHGMNASTFTARVIVSTHSDLISAITGAVGALKGPLHGGAPGPALDLVFEIGSAERAEEVVRGRLAAGERLMGFGHRVYKVRDPRAEVLSRAASELAAGGENAELHALAREVEAVVLRVLGEAKPGRRIQTNVEYYTALLLHGLGLDKELFTPTFAVGRVAGWTAHCLEQLSTGRLIRPASTYIGEVDRSWREVGQRS